MMLEVWKYRWILNGVVRCGHRDFSTLAAGGVLVVLSPQLSNSNVLVELRSRSLEGRGG